MCSYNLICIRNKKKLFTKEQHKEITNHKNGVTPIIFHRISIIFVFIVYNITLIKHISYLEILNQR